ncbi:hypothetical protein INR49_022549 [Caranx melampygus]|nr:hypothetical protein INR49_022549 [Caranx melampygus]
MLVVNTSLDDVIQGDATGGGLAPQLAVDFLGQHLQQMTHGAERGNRSRDQILSTDVGVAQLCQY